MSYYNAYSSDFQTYWRYSMLTTGSKGSRFPAFKCLSAGVAVALVYFLLEPQPVQAYIDPGTGGMIIQGLIGLLAGALAMLVVFWKRVTFSIRKLFKHKSSASDETEGTDTDKT
jgi:hypothetical protein